MKTCTKIPGCSELISTFQESYVKLPLQTPKEKINEFVKQFFIDLTKNLADCELQIKNKEICLSTNQFERIKYVVNFYSACTIIDDECINGLFNQIESLMKLNQSKKV